MCKKSRFLTKTHGLIGSRQTYLPRDAANGRSHRSLNNGSEFYAEAKRIWENEQGRPSLCTVQALIAMYEYNKLQGKDRFGWIFLQTAVDMAIELGLFRRGDAGDISTDAQGYSRNFTAWSLYKRTRKQLIKTVANLDGVSTVHVRPDIAEKVADPSVVATPPATP